MKIEINTLYWTNTNPRMTESHKRVINHFELDVIYHEENSEHGAWMDRICSTSNADVIGFLDIDCVPLSKEKVDESINYVTTHDTFIGITQVANYIKPATHVYAAPAFFFITKSSWEKLKTSFRDTKKTDVGESITYKAEETGMKFRFLYPTAYEDVPVGGVWPLGNYGFYGVGTVFDNACYHLYQGRMNNNIERFEKRCQQIVDGSFSTQGFTSSTDFNHNYKIWPSY